ncbi:Yqey-like protein-domain-containing protein [Lasiosphaeria miniovina]|uniref:Altered inheritance of mitochondria protein 41 n=1 Tax=Lasiosphaeria miniovina TaxID=1954250 RepID=A0AA40ALY1_9PEZI|nr:Yqey-like protein-domain-containing protein [Lasiosphaeria miniovina]KAK0718239.1 Yqey-like protein-domain-containing protein [Lasiosphaeria miniovina]
MASTTSAFIFRRLGRPSLQQTWPMRKAISLAPLRQMPRSYSSEAPPPPLLAKLKTDLKTAMRNKDSTRLAVLRSVLSATLNASKTDKPIKTDLQLVALLRKIARTSQDSAGEFRGAGRDDLADKEEAQAHLLEEYAASSGIESISEEQLREIIIAAKDELESKDAKSLAGELMKAVFKPGGPLEGKDVEKSLVARIVKEVAKPQ